MIGYVRYKLRNNVQRRTILFKVVKCRINSAWYEPRLRFLFSPFSQWFNSRTSLVPLARIDVIVLWNRPRIHHRVPMNVTHPLVERHPWDTCADVRALFISSHHCPLLRCKEVFSWQRQQCHLRQSTLVA